MRVFIFGECPHCGDDLENIGDEFKTMQDGEVKELKCKNCGECFEVKATVEMHIETLQKKGLKNGNS